MLNGDELRSFIEWVAANFGENIAIQCKQELEKNPERDALEVLEYFQHYPNGTSDVSFGTMCFTA